MLIFHRIPKRILIFAVCLSSAALFFIITNAQTTPQNLLGRILINVEKNGEAWYVHPESGIRHSLGTPTEAFNVMKHQSEGIRHSTLTQYNNTTFPASLGGKILLDVERNGEAYYIHPETLQGLYLASPYDAFQIMKEFGLGITNENLKKIATPTSMNIDVAFTTQAPQGNWSDPRQQEGCEEAVAFMASQWIKNNSFSQPEATTAITQAADYTQTKYGESHDTSLQDTYQWLLKEYFNVTTAELRYSISTQDIIDELNQGNIVIASINSEIVRNPHFNYPGPLQHMILIHGYDNGSEEFITHDPGTRFGDNWRYDRATLERGLTDYETGSKEIIESNRNGMIVISR